MQTPGMEKTMEEQNLVAQVSALEDQAEGDLGGMPP